MAENIQSAVTYMDQQFRNLDLARSEISITEFIDCTFTNCSLVESSLHQCQLMDCQFKDSDLSLMTLPSSRLIGVRFEGCKIIGLDWTLLDWPAGQFGRPMAFNDCVLNHSTFLGLHMTEVKFEDCLAREVDFREANLVRAEFGETDLSGSLFQNTDLTGADLSRASNYQIAADQNMLSKAKFSLPEAMSLLYGMDIELVEKPAW
ncbi:MAG: pentapeptide repeat-containing protein [Anaerolineales bacterium]